MESVENIHNNMLKIFTEEKIKIDKILYCPHEYSENCGCRKPEVGMFYRAQNELPFLIDLPKSFMVGDSDSDIKAGNDLGTETVFVKNGLNKEPHIKPNFVVNNLSDFVIQLTQEPPTIT